METFHSSGSPLAAYLEGEGYSAGIGPNEEEEERFFRNPSDPNQQRLAPALASLATVASTLQKRSSGHAAASTPSTGTLRRLHHACSSAVNARLGWADNEKFLEHFRYIIVASQLLNEYLDHGSLPHIGLGVDGTVDEKNVLSSVPKSFYGAVATAVAAFALVYLLKWTRGTRGDLFHKSRVVLALVILMVGALVGYTYVRRQWLRTLRHTAVVEVSNLTDSWHAFEISTSSALSLIQEVELVSRGYKLSSPMAPISRLEDQTASRRCVRLRKALYTAYCDVIPATFDAFASLQALIDRDDLERYFDVYDISVQEVNDLSGVGSFGGLDDDVESLKSLRILGYRTGVLRRISLCSLMALESDGGKSDFAQWRSATTIMSSTSQIISKSASKIKAILSEMETIVSPTLTNSSGGPSRLSHGPAREKLRSQVRKISALSSGIRGLQAKMQVLREETNRSIEQQSDDLTDLGPNLMTQYESIGADLRELTQAWELGKASLQSNIVKQQERRISRASSAFSHPSSLGGLTAVEEGGAGGPADALKALSGEPASNRSSAAISSSSPGSADEEVFEAVAMPRQRTSLTRDERIVRMHEERERQANARAARDANTSMLRELESVISLRPGPRRNGEPGERVTSL